MSDLRNSLVGISTPEASSVEGRRWLVLLIYSWIEFNQALVWITYSASAPEAKMLYGKQLSESGINLLLNWGPIMYLVFVPIVMVMLSNNFRGKGVYYTIGLGAVLCAAGSIARMIPTWCGVQQHPIALLLVHVGQILNGAAGPSMAGACSAFAACWFAPDERTLATAVSYGICALGPALAFIFAMYVRDSQQLEDLLLIEMISAVASCLLWKFVPSMPNIAPSASQKVARTGNLHDTMQSNSHSVAGFWHSCWQACTNLSFVLLMTSGGIVFGVFQCWASSLTNTIQICEQNSDSGTGSFGTVHGGDDGGCMSEQLTQWLGFGGNIGTWFGTLVIGPIADRFFPRKFKSLLLILFAVQLVLFSLYTLSLPIGNIPVTIPSSGGSLFVLFCAASAFLGATTPLFFELGAEVTYPANEGVSAGLISGMLNFGGLVLLVGLSSIPPSWDGVLITGTVFACALMVLPISEVYLRSNFDDSKARR